MTPPFFCPLVSPFLLGISAFARSPFSSATPAVPEISLETLSNGSRATSTTENIAAHLTNQRAGGGGDVADVPQFSLFPPHVVSSLQRHTHKHVEFDADSDEVRCF